MTEKQFENKVKDFLKSVGVYRLGTAENDMPVKPTGYYLKRWGGGKYIPKGCPDLQIVVGVFSVDAELKCETGRADPMQIQKLRQIRDAGAYALLLYPKDFEWFKKFIKTLIKRDQMIKQDGYATEVRHACEF